MSNKRKLRKQKEAETTNYTLEDLVTDAVDAFGAKIAAVMAEAETEGKHGVMVVESEWEVFVCDLVPAGRVWRAGSMDAVNKLRERLEQ